MALESATYISDLVLTNPAAGDNVSAGDDHLRLLKAVLQATFPYVTGAITATNTELNYVDGVTSSIQTQINSISSQVGEPYTWVSKSADYSAATGDAILADTSGGAWVLTLPSSQSVGNVIRVCDIAGTFGTYNLQVARNGSEINNVSEDMYLDISDVSVMFVYTGATYGWRAI